MVPPTKAGGWSDSQWQCRPLRSGNDSDRNNGAYICPHYQQSALHIEYPQPYQKSTKMKPSDILCRHVHQCDTRMLAVGVFLYIASQHQVESSMENEIVSSFQPSKNVARALNQVCQLNGRKYGSGGLSCSLPVDRSSRHDELLQSSAL
jgi:hypothetical protein